MSNLKLPRKGTKYVARKAQKCDLVCNRGAIVVVIATYDETIASTPKPIVLAERLLKPKSVYGSATYYVDDFNENFVLASSSEGKRLLRKHGGSFKTSAVAVEPKSEFKVGDYVELKPGESGFVDFSERINVFTPRETQGRFTVVDLWPSRVVLRPGHVKLVIAPYYGTTYDVKYAEAALRLQHVEPLRPVYKVGDWVMVTEGDERYKTFKVIDVDTEALRARSRCAYKTSPGRTYSDECLTPVSIAPSEVKRTFVSAAGNWVLTPEIVPRLTSPSGNMTMSIEHTRNNGVSVLRVRNGINTIGVPLDGLKELLKLAEKQ